MKKKKLIPILIVCGILVFIAGNAVGNSLNADKNDVANIQQLLKDTCDCETIEKSTYAKGVQYSNNQGFSTEKVEFVLTNCNYSNLNAEAARVAEKLNANDLDDFDLVTLYFMSDQKEETISIKNGQIQ